MVRFSRAVRLALSIACIATSADAGFADSFDTPRVVEESASPSTSGDPAWWLNSGARFSTGVVGSTVQGRLPSNDPWRKSYAASSALDTDGGYLPQNLFRLLTRARWADAIEEVRFRIVETNRTDTPNRDGWSGILLFLRYVDGDNTYYAGLRQDGQAVIKRKAGGQYTTLGLTRVYAGQYDRWTNPNLVPEGVWIGLRATVVDATGEGGARITLEVNDPSLGSGWRPVLEVLDKDPIRSEGSGGIRIDYMDVELEDFSIADPKEPSASVGTPAGVGVFAGNRWQIDDDLDGTLDLDRRYGRSDDIPVPADYDGDGVTDLAVYRSYGRWLADFDRGGGTDLSVTLGNADAIPVPADYDGDGRADIAVFRPSKGKWQIDLDRDGTPDWQLRYGKAGDVPLPADYDGDGYADLAVYRPSYGGWFVDVGLDGGTDLSLILGGDGAIPVPGDYDGDGTTDPAVFAKGLWKMDFDADGSPDLTLPYGRDTDRPVPADYDGDGVADLAVHRPSYGGWFLDLDRNGGTDVSLILGGNGAIPLRPHGAAIDRVFPGS